MVKKVISLTLIILLIFSISAYANENGKINRGTNKGEYFISFKYRIDEKLLKDYGVKYNSKYKYQSVVVAELDESTAAQLTSNPLIEYVELNGTIIADEQSIPWGVSEVNAISVQQTGSTGVGIKVAIMDTGIDKFHIDLKVTGGVSFVKGVKDFQDDAGHGSHVAGIVAAKNNSVGVLGVAPDVQLYAIKVLNRFGIGDYKAFVSGIEWAIDQGIDIINMSFSTPTYSKTFERALQRAYNSNILLISSAGNLGFNSGGSITYPGSSSYVIAVGAVDENNQRALFSSVGQDMELVAPGVSILSTTPNNGYFVMSGTSMASPHVVGVAALIWAEHPNLSNSQIRALLKNSSTSLGDTFQYGSGLVDTKQAFLNVTASN